MADFKFPDPKDVPPKHPVVMCPSERVLNLYKQETGEDAQRKGKKVKAWFEQRALSEGWAAVHFLPEVQTLHGAGCLLLAPGAPKITNLASAALGLFDESDEDEE